MHRLSAVIAEYVRLGLTAFIPVAGILWLLGAPTYFGLALGTASYLSLMAGLGVAVGFLRRPFGREAGLLELAIAVIAFGCWAWGAINHEAWMVQLLQRGPEKWVPGLIALVSLVEALRRNCGNPIALIVVACAAYALFGHHLPPAVEAAYSPPTRLILYLYNDTSGVPGLVLRVAATVVLGFVVMGAVMSQVGASVFFTDMALAGMGSRRGGPAKVAVLASSLFGSISGSTVGNIMTTGVVTIPLMKRTGFPGRLAAATEAVASNGGQLAPPVMGATAFLIAEFLQVPYAQVVAAALIPAVIYYLVLYMQVDLIARRLGLQGLPAHEIPQGIAVFCKGWPYLLPLGLLIYLLFWLGYSPGKAALFAAALTFGAGLLAKGIWPTPVLLWRILLQAGETFIVLLLICAAAGIVIGALNVSGLGFLLTNALAHVGSTAGLLPMLVITAVIAIVLGMGMPTAAVYVVLSIILAPALTRMGIEPMAAHLFIFYFGLVSMLTPPVAIASYTAAGLADAPLWGTSTAALRLALPAFVLPFLFVVNPALIGQGDLAETVIAVGTLLVASFVLAVALSRFEGDRNESPASIVFLVVLAAVAGSASIWVGPSNFLALVVAGAVLGLFVGWQRLVDKQVPSPRAAKSRAEF